VSAGLEGNQAFHRLSAKVLGPFRRGVRRAVRLLNDHALAISD
jgi:hypothetical protein